MKLHGTMAIKDNTLYIGGVSTVELAKKYQTPLYVFDEELIRNVIKEHRTKLQYKHTDQCTKHYTWEYH